MPLRYKKLKKFGRVQRSYQRNKVRWHKLKTKFRHGLFMWQVKYCYEYTFPKYDYRNLKFETLPSVLFYIPVFENFYRADIELANGNENLKFIFGIQENGGHPILHMKERDLLSDPRRRGYAHRGSVVSYNDIIEHLERFSEKFYQDHPRFTEMDIADKCILYIDNRNDFIRLIQYEVYQAIRQSITVDPNSIIKSYYDLCKYIEALCILTHIIEPHIRRIPGIDKMARGIFANISQGCLSFREGFDREGGAFFMAKSLQPGRKVVMGTDTQTTESFVDSLPQTTYTSIDQMSESSQEEMPEAPRGPQRHPLY